MEGMKKGGEVERGVEGVHNCTMRFVLKFGITEKEKFLYLLLVIFSHIFFFSIFTPLDQNYCFHDIQ